MTEAWTGGPGHVDVGAGSGAPYAVPNWTADRGWTVPDGHRAPPGWTAPRIDTGRLPHATHPVALTPHHVTSSAPAHSLPWDAHVVGALHGRSPDIEAIAPPPADLGSTDDGPGPGPAGAPVVGKTAIQPGAYEQPGPAGDTNATTVGTAPVLAVPADADPTSPDAIAMSWYADPRTFDLEELVAAEFTPTTFTASPFERSIDATVPLPPPDSPTSHGLSTNLTDQFGVPTHPLEDHGHVLVGHH